MKYLQSKIITTLATFRYKV